MSAILKKPPKWLTKLHEKSFEWFKDHPSEAQFFARWAKGAKV